MPLSREGRNDSPALRKDLETLSRKIKNSEKLITEVVSCLDNGMMEAVNNKLFKLEDTVEKAANISRLLPAYTGENDAFLHVCSVVKEISGAYVEYTKEDWFHMRLPVLLPKKESGNSKYIRTIAYSALNEYFGQNRHEKYKEPVVLVYDHVYNESVPESKYRDHDNIELNVVTDMVALYCLTDDSPLLCKHYYTSRKGQTSFTDVYIVPQKDFVKWLGLQPVQNG